MKNIIITPRQIRREVIFLIVAFVVANLMNIFAIAGYDSSWKELVTSIPILLLLSGVLYFLMGIFRLIYYAVTKLL
jgi:hypothetical protein